MPIFQDYFDASVDHRNVHKCGGYPFANGDFLNKLGQVTSATSVLEIGTAIGYSAYCFAANSKDVHVTTIDMKSEHEDIAKMHWTNLGVESQITMLIGHSQDVIPELTQKFDIIFFDGYAPNPEEVDLYVEKLNEDGVLITTNLSWNKTAAEYMEKLNQTSLITTQLFDTAFSSKSQTKIDEYCEIWGQLIS